MKKALRLVIAVLMLATLVPVSSAAPDGVPSKCPPTGGNCK